MGNGFKSHRTIQRVPKRSDTPLAINIRSKILFFTLPYPHYPT